MIEISPAESLDVLRNDYGRVVLGLTVPSARLQGARSHGYSTSGNAVQDPNGRPPIACDETNSSSSTERGDSFRQAWATRYYREGAFAAGRHAAGAWVAVMRDALSNLF